MPAARSPHLPQTCAALRVVLASEPDAHRRQRELVRASLLACPRAVRGGASRRTA